jgi:hypothetical protein
MQKCCLDNMGTIGLSALLVPSGDAVTTVKCLDNDGNRRGRIPRRIPLDIPHQHRGRGRFSADLSGRQAPHRIYDSITDKFIVSNKTCSRRRWRRLPVGNYLLSGWTGQRPGYHSRTWRTPILLNAPTADRCYCVAGPESGPSQMG